MKNDYLKDLKSRAIGTYIRLNYTRKSRLYCVGAAKTGTHSIDSMFDKTVRSKHEADSEEVIKKILDISEHRINREELLSYVRKRDARLCLDVDSSQLNFFLLDYLLPEFPDARFLLTIRDCYSWLTSFIDDSLRRGTSKNWIKLREHRFQSSTLSHPPEERALQKRGLYTLSGYLSYWAKHNEKVLLSVPHDRLLVVRTEEISKRIYDIADFAGLPRSSVQAGQSHSFKNPEKFNVLKEIDKDYLQQKVQEFCAPLMNKFFPEIELRRGIQL